MRRCTQEDKRAYRKAIALLVSFAMLASTFYMGPAFAAENAESDETGVNTEYVQPEAALQREDAEGNAAAAAAPYAIPGEDASDAVEGIVEENTEEEAMPDAEAETPQADTVEEDREQPSVSTMGKWDQMVRVILVVNSKKTLLKPDANGNYTFKSSITKVRGIKTVKLMISNPAECPLTYSEQKVVSNAGGSFLETETTGYSVNDINTIRLFSDTVEAAGGEMAEAEPVLDGTGGESIKPLSESDDDSSAENGGEPSGEGEEGGNPDSGQEEPAVDPDAIQVTEITVKVKGTGEGSFYFKAQAGEHYVPFSGKIFFRQTRPTTVMNRTAKVRTKTGKPKTIPRKYKQKYFKIIKEDDNETFKYAFRTVTAAYEIKRASGISESGYRANQGGGTDGTYCYHALCKKGSKTYAKIVKTRLKDMKVVKVSKDLKLHHANDITYDPVNKRLVVTHNAVKRKRVTFVNPKTLKSMGYKDIKIPKTLKGATKAQLSAVKGFASVTYMTGGKYAGKYIGIISGNHNFMVLDKNFKPVEYITVDKKFNGSQIYYQGADNIGDRLYVVIYPRKKSRRDFIVAYDMDGNFKGKVNLLKGYETENMFHAGNAQYMTLYKPVTKVWYTPKNVKQKVKLTKKERALAKPNKKGKRPKYKTVTKVIKEKHVKSVKRSYIFKMKKVTL